MPKRILVKLVFGILCLLPLLGGCNSQSTPSRPTEFDVPKAPTMAPKPTTIPFQTATPRPTPTTRPTATPIPAPKTGKIGERVEFAGAGLVLNSVDRVASLGKAQAAASGQIFVILDFTIDNASVDDIVSYGPSYMKVKDSQAYEYRPYQNQRDDVIYDGQLQPGDKVRGTLTFAVPKDDLGLVFKFWPPSFAREFTIALQ